MHRLDIKPLSVNNAWQGKRFKTKEYKDYEQSMLLILPKKVALFEKMKINFVFGFSSKLADIDNPVKLFLDILQKKYSFNDSCVYEVHIKKEIVKKGKEFIEFKIENYDTNSD